MQAYHNSAATLSKHCVNLRYEAEIAFPQKAPEYVIVPWSQEMEVIRTLILLSVEGLEMLASCLELASIFIGWLVHLLITFDFDHNNMVAFLYEEIRVKETPLGMLPFAPGVLNRIEITIGGLDPCINGRRIFLFHKMTDEFPLRLVIGYGHIERRPEVK